MFSSWMNSIVTGFAVFLIPQLWHLIQWAFISADWFGSRDQCVWWRVLGVYYQSIEPVYLWFLSGK